MGSDRNEVGSGADRFGFPARMGLFYAAIFTVYGTQMPYLPLWLDWRGLTAAEIATVSALPLFVRLIATPVVAFAADRSGNHRGAVILLAWGALAAALLLGQAQGFARILIATLLMGIAVATAMPLTETVAMAGVRAHGYDYGRMRLWGSLTFILASIGGGPIVDAFGPSAGLWLITAGIAATALAAHLLPRPSADGAAGTSRRPLRLADVGQLAASRAFLLFLVASTAVQAAHATFYTFGTLHWRALGISTWWIGALWGVGVLAEVAIFAWSAPIVRRLGAVPLLLAGAVAAIVRWIAMAFDPPLALLMPLQVLHGLTFGAAHLGAIHFMARAVPERQAGTAQALNATVSAGVGMAGAMLISGALYGTHGGRTYLAMAVIAGLGLAAGLLLQRSWDGGEVGAGTR